MRLTDIYWTVVRGFPLRSLITCNLNPVMLPRSTQIPHAYGITVTDGVREFGESCFIGSNVTIGINKPVWEFGMWVAPPLKVTRVGNRVVFGIGCSVFAGVTIEDDCTIGAGAIVLADVPRGTKVKGVWK
jgi:serine acetyltransferase